MKYEKQLPAVRHLLTVAQAAQFPGTRVEITKVAKSQQFSEVMTDFLELFPADEVFKSKVDFMTRCEETELSILQYQKIPE